MKITVFESGGGESVSDLLSDLLRQRKDEDFQLLNISVEEMPNVIHELSCDIAIFSLGSSDTKNLTDIRKIHRLNPRMLMIFVSDCKSLVSFAFEIRAFQFFFLPLDKEYFITEFWRAVGICRESRLQYSHYKSNIFHQNIQAMDIAYIKADNHRLTIFLVGEGSYTCYGTIAKAQKTLEPYGFIRIHKSILVNTLHILEMKGNKIKMKYQMGELPVGRVYKKFLRENC